MAVNSRIPRERIFVSEDQIFRLYGRQEPQSADGLRPTQIPEYIIQFLVASSERSEKTNAGRLRN
jgi:hypothetical protein